MDKTLTLTRFSNHPEQGALGEFTFQGEHVAYSMEQPWKDNAPFKSCVPCGEYKLVPWNSPKHPDTFVLVNPELDVVMYQNPQKPKNRFACLIHKGNWVTDIAGCIAPGRGIVTDNERRLMVTQSKLATGKVIDSINKHEIDKLLILTYCSKQVAS